MYGQHKLKKTAVPHVFAWTRSQTPSALRRQERRRRREDAMPVHVEADHDVLGREEVVIAEVNGKK